MSKHNSFTSNSEGLILKKTALFAVKLVLFAAVILFLLFQCVMPQYTELYNAAIIDKYNRLKSIDQPKIILVGDSNVAFGFDSEMIQNAFNMPVVNFGLHASLGQDFHTDMIKAYIKKGDIVILAPAGYNYKIRSFDCVMAWVTIENHFDLWKGISYQNYPRMLAAFPTYLKRAIGLFITNKGNRVEDSPWGRQDFNIYGDYSHPRPICRIDGDNYSQYFQSDTLNEQLRDYWNDYNKYVLSKGATLYMSAPPILSVTLDVDLDAMQKQLDDELDFPMISNLKDYIYPLEDFYDTGFHLNDNGKVLRTQQFIKDLSAVLNK